MNCWKILKTNKLKRKDEICLGVYVAKAEKIVGIVYGANLRTVYKIDNQQRSSEQENVQRLTLKRLGVGYKLLVVEVLSPNVWKHTMDKI